MITKIKALKSAKMSKVDIHFAVERDFYRTFLGAVGILEYKIVAAFFRKKIMLAIEEAEQKTGQVLLNKNNLFFLRETNRRRLRVRAHRISGSSIVQIHVYVNETLRAAFLNAIQILGYNTRTEFFREKMRLAINDAGRIMGFSLLDKKGFSDEA